VALQVEADEMTGAQGFAGQANDRNGFGIQEHALYR
jgi:hypothetical protein